jgi:hypothetical protein
VDVVRLTPVIVAQEAVGLESIGALSVYLSWRAPKRMIQQHYREWHASSVDLPLDEIAVAPETVLYWDSDPERTNSLKRFAYMLGNRALPHLIQGGNETGNIKQLIDNPGEYELPGYEHSREQAAEMTANYFEHHPGHTRRANTRLVFRYAPPTDIDSRRALHEYLASLETAE